MTVLTHPHAGSGLVASGRGSSGRGGRGRGRKGKRGDERPKARPVVIHLRMQTMSTLMDLLKELDAGGEATQNDPSGSVTTAASASRAALRAHTRFGSGAKILVDTADGGVAPGRIVHVHKDGTYTVEYTDEDRAQDGQPREKHVAAERIRIDDSSNVIGDDDDDDDDVYDDDEDGDDGDANDGIGDDGEDQEGSDGGGGDGGGGGGASGNTSDDGDDAFAERQAVLDNMRLLRKMEEADRRAQAKATAEAALASAAATAATAAASQTSRGEAAIKPKVRLMLADVHNPKEQKVKQESNILYG